MRFTWLQIVVLATSAFGQTSTYPYYLKSFAGTFPLGDGGPATSALLYYPNAAVADPAGNLYILDSNNYRIRKVTTDGKIETYAQSNITAYDMKLAADGSLYIGASGQVLRLTQAGFGGSIAGTGKPGYGGDGGPANGAQVGSVYGIALDSSGSFYFTDSFSSGSRVRMATINGTIRTIAGTASHGYNGDGQPAASANLNFPRGLVIDNSGNIFVADTDNYRIRKFTVGGAISTIAGTGVSGKPANGPATGTPLGSIQGLCLDSSNNLYAADASNDVVLKITPDGTLTRVAGNFNGFGSPGDGIATGVSLLGPGNVGCDSSGSLYIPDGTHLVRKLTPDGKLITVAGRVHYGGDNGPAVSALLNQPTDVALDGQGNVFISDGDNYRIRKVTSDGTIGPYAGNGIPGIPSGGTSAGRAQVPYIYAMTVDSKGALYLATFYQIWKVTPDGIVADVAGTGFYGNTGDGGPATSATFEDVAGVAVDASGNVYVADGVAQRVRMIAADSGIIRPFAGNGTWGRGGDGGPATSAQLALQFSAAALAVDSKGNEYIGDSFNYEVRMVNPAGTISTVVGNGTSGRPDGVKATSTGFGLPASMGFDGSGNLYIAADGDIFQYQPSSGIIHLITGHGYSAPTDGVPALSVGAFRIQNIKIDQNGDIYAVDSIDNTIWKLILNSPTTFTMADGNNQTAQTGRVLPKPLKVQLNGRAGFGVAGVTVNFAVTSGSATLGATSALTDSNGSAMLGVTLGTAAGNVTVTATAVGSGLPAVHFTESAILPPVCTVPQPVVTSVNSAGDFGGGTTFAPGSWLEIKGTHLAQSTRPWAGSDFNGANAPTSLDDVSVTIDGKKAYVGYISPAQINVQAPGDTVTGTVQLAVTTSSCPSDVFTVQEAAVAPGVLAPSSFNVNGKQYLVALFQDGVTFVGNPNLVPGAPFRPAAPGDIITAYGIGFGAVTPASAPGVVASDTDRIAADVLISLGTALVPVNYSGLAPGSVGLYQFNFAVPNVPDDDYPIVFQVGATKTTQTVYLTVHK